MPDDLPGFEFYPTPDEVDAWLDGIWEEGQAMAFQAEPIEGRGFPKSLGIDLSASPVSPPSDTSQCEGEAA